MDRKAPREHLQPLQAGTRWRTCEPRQLLWAEFNDEFVIYHASSGKTHFLNSGSGYLLQSLLREPHTLREIAQQFSPEDEIGDHSSRDVMIAEMLQYFEELGLVERS